MGLGDVLEDAMAHHVAQAAGRDLSEIYVGVEFKRRHGGGTFELDVVAVVGSRVLAMSCDAANDNQGKTYKAHEVVVRAEQLAGGLARPAFAWRRRGTASRRLEAITRPSWEAPNPLRIFDLEHVQAFARGNRGALKQWVAGPDAPAFAGALPPQAVDDPFGPELVALVGGNPLPIVYGALAHKGRRAAEEPFSAVLISTPESGAGAARAARLLDAHGIKCGHRQLLAGDDPADTIRELRDAGLSETAVLDYTGGTKQFAARAVGAWRGPTSYTGPDCVFLFDGQGKARRLTWGEVLKPRAVPELHDRTVAYVAGPTGALSPELDQLVEAAVRSAPNRCHGRFHLRPNKQGEAVEISCGPYTPHPKVAALVSGPGRLFVLAVEQDPKSVRNRAFELRTLARAAAGDHARAALIAPYADTVDTARKALAEPWDAPSPVKIFGRPDVDRWIAADDAAELADWFAS